MSQRIARIGITNVATCLPDAQLHPMFGADEHSREGPTGPENMMMPLSPNESDQKSPSTGTQFLSIEVSGMKVGATLNAPIYEDCSGRNLVLLLSTGTTLTQKLLARLERRGIARVLVHPNEAKRLQNRKADRSSNDAVRQAVDRAASQIVRPASSRWSCTPASFVHKITARGAEVYESSRNQLFAKEYQSSLIHVERMFDGLSHGDVNFAASLAAVSSESLLRIADDLDLFVALGLAPATDKYPCKHSLQTAMLAMSIGTILGLKSSELIELGIGCLIHDAGMLKIQQELVHAKRALNTIEFLEITKHPTLTFDALRDVNGVPNSSRLVAYQMHERLNGSGYPRRRKGNQIHYLAKVAAVADVYVALVSPRPYRSGMLAYDAMTLLLHGAGQGLYDTDVVRALLHTVSLFPIGSFVELSDGRLGKVVRSNRDAYISPMVEIINVRSGEWSNEVVDLRQQRHLRILRAISR